jgi:hypothetical protein
MLSYFMDSERKAHVPLRIIMRMATVYHFLRAARDWGFAYRSCSEVFVLGAYSTEMILGEVGRAPTIQFTGGGAAYNVVDEAS